MAEEYKGNIGKKKQTNDIKLYLKKMYFRNNKEKLYIYIFIFDFFKSTVYSWL